MYAKCLVKYINNVNQALKSVSVKIYLRNDCYRESITAKLKRRVHSSFLAKYQMKMVLGYQQTEIVIEEMYV